MLGKICASLALAAVACAVTATAQAAAVAPTASTGAAASVTGKTAVLGATVNPGGAHTVYYFQYGATSSYGAQTATRNAGGAADLAVSARLFRLTAGTIYHYRVVATNGAGTADGSDQTFMTTLAPPPTVITGTPASVAGKAATVVGMVTPNGAATTFTFQYGTTTDYGLQTATRYAGAGSNVVSIFGRLSGLTPGQTYHYRLVATSSSGTADGSDQTFTTTQRQTQRHH